MSVAGEAGHIFREPSGQRLHLQLQLGDACCYERKRGPEAFTQTTDAMRSVGRPKSPVMRTSDGQIRWMNVTAYLKRHGTATKEMVFEGEPFTGLNVARMRAWARNGASTLACGGFGG